MHDAATPLDIPPLPRAALPRALHPVRAERILHPTSRLRWLAEPGTTTRPYRLQRALICVETGTEVWQDIPIVVGDPG